MTWLPDPWSALRVSLQVGLWAVLLTAPIAVGLGWWLARREFAGKALVTMLLMAPLVVPPVVTGLLLLKMLSPVAPLGRWLASWGIEVAFQPAGAVLAAAVVGLPLFVQASRSAFESVDPRCEEVARSIGWSEARLFWKVTMPLAAPGLAAGALLAFARALGEFGATAVLSGNVEGRTRTLSLAVYTLLESPEGESSSWLLVAFSLALSLVALWGYERLLQRHRRRLGSSA